MIYKKLWQQWYDRVVPFIKPMINVKFIIVFFGAFALGVCITSNITEKYLAIVIGIFASITAFLGVVYNMDKQKEIKELEISNEKYLDEIANLRIKREEMTLAINACYNYIIKLTMHPVYEYEKQSPMYEAFQTIHSLQALYKLADTNCFYLYINAVKNFIPIFDEQLKTKKNPKNKTTQEHLEMFKQLSEGYNCIIQSIYQNSQKQ